jgi:hypothetical protein
MTNKYWIGPDGGNFNTTANWSYSSGGPANATLPASGDSIIFDLDNYYTINSTGSM